MVSRRRKPPEIDAVEYAEKATDKKHVLEVKYINAYKGRGVFAKNKIHKGDFVVEYRGQLIDAKEEARRRGIYNKRCTIFMYSFQWNEKTWCIDASREDGSLGRLVNDDGLHPNCKMKKIIAQGKPHLCLFALRDINADEEITYNYGGSDWPWRKEDGEKVRLLTDFAESDMPKAKDLPIDKQDGEKPHLLTNFPESDMPKAKDLPINKQDGEKPHLLTNFPESDMPKAKDLPINKQDGEKPHLLTNFPESDMPKAKDLPINKQDGEKVHLLTDFAESDMPKAKDLPFDKQDGEKPHLLTNFPESDMPKAKDLPINKQDGEKVHLLTDFAESDMPKAKDLPFDKQDGEKPHLLTNFPESDMPKAKDLPINKQDGEKVHLLTDFAERDMPKAKDLPFDKQDGEKPHLLTNFPESDMPKAKDLPINKQDGEKPHLLTNFPESDMPKAKDLPINKQDHGFSVTRELLDSPPKLRRTKSILWGNRTEYDSDEMFGMTSDESEEYIPETDSSEDSRDSTKSNILHIDVHSFERGRSPTKKSNRPNQQLKKRNCNIPKHARSLAAKRQRYENDELHRHSSEVMENNTLQTDDGNTSMPPMLHSTPSRSGSNSHEGKRSSKRARSLTRNSIRPNKQLKERHSTKLKTQLEKRKSCPPQNSRTHLAGQEEENDQLPDSSSFKESQDSLCIQAVTKKEDGSRMYNKKQYCLFCKKGVIKISRHLERAHKNESEVAQALSFNKGSKERKVHFEHLRNRGNFAHNVEVLNAGTGQLVPRKQPQGATEAKDFLHCAFCQGLFRKKILWKHASTCKLKPSGQKNAGKTRVQALCAFAIPPPSGIKEDFWKLLTNMVQDDVFSVVKTDRCILEFGEHLFNRLGHDTGKHEYIRQKMRELGRLLLSSRKISQLKTIEEHVLPANFMQVVESVKIVAGYERTKNTYKCPSLALKLGHSLTKISTLIESRFNVENNYSAAKSARTFRQIYVARWHEMISAASLRTLQEAKWNAPLLLPFTRDVQIFHSFLETEQQKLCSLLSAEASPQAWSGLAKVTLTQVILFNRRRSGEVSKMPQSAYSSPNSEVSMEDIGDALSDLEKKLCHHFRRIEIRGKRGRKVPILLTPAMQASLDLLVAKREVCEVPHENGYLFARPKALSCYRGSDCLRELSKLCGATNPQSLTSTKLRKQTATLSQVLNLSNTELDQLADFLGHDVRVHRQFYRLPEGTLQLAKISKVLMALEQGRVGEFKGKSLDDINIEPEDSVEADSDIEGLNEADSQECPVTSTQSEEDTEPIENHGDEIPVPDVMLSEATQSQPTQNKQSNARQPVKRKKWDEEEVHAVEKHLMSFITSCRVPGKQDCDKCLQLEKEALKNRDWLAIKFYVKNRITTLKRKV